MITRKPFESIGEIKSKGEFIKKGKIFPARILKSEIRKDQHHIKSGSNQWAINTATGYLLFADNTDGEFECVVRITASNGAFQGSPYLDNGSTYWQGNSNLSESELLKLFNDKYLR